jgi:DNA-binding CsgD family transcriptional regulator
VADADATTGEPPLLERAQRLFVTRRTVEMHLTSVYGKLEIDSRAELPRALGGG